MPELTMGSLFDGIGGFPLAAVRNGITAAPGHLTMEPFPIRRSLAICSAVSTALQTGKGSLVGLPATMPFLMPPEAL